MQGVHSSAISRHEDAQIQPGLQRVGGAVGVLAGLGGFLLVAAVLIPLTSAHGLKAPFEGKEAQFYDFVRDTLTIFLPLGLLQTVGILATLIFVGALDDRLRPMAPTASPIAALFGYTAVALLTLAVAAYLPIDQSIAGGVSKATLLPAITAAFAVNGTAALAGSLFHVVWLSIVNWIAIRRGGLPRVLAYYGFLVVVVSLVTASLGVKGFGPLASAFWYIGVGAVMWRRPQPASQRVSGLP